MRNEFATCADESAHPGLWRGALGMWLPSAQTEGSRLFDYTRTSNSSFVNGASLQNFSGRTVFSCQGANSHALISPNGTTGYAHASSGGWSVSFWIYEITHDFYPVPITMRLNGVAGHGAAASGGDFSVYNNDAIVSNTGAPRFTGQWNHYCATWSGSSGIGRMYLNGIPQNNARTDSGYGLANTYIGSGYAGDSINGYMDAIIAYKRALSWQEVKKLSLRPEIAWERRRRILSNGFVQEVNGLVATGVDTAAPSVGTPTLGQIHVLTAGSVDSGTPTVGEPDLSEINGLSADGVNSGTPTVGSPTLSQIHALDADGVDSGTPSVGSPTLGQIHILVADDTDSGTPTVGSPTVDAPPSSGCRQRIFWIQPVCTRKDRNCGKRTKSGY